MDANNTNKNIVYLIRNVLEVWMDDPTRCRNVFYHRRNSFF